MSLIQRDSFWDGKTGGGVRCSSDGTSANMYQDPSIHRVEGNDGRSLASLLPGSSAGLRGIVIPRATSFGGSRGFDPHKPRLVNIDPDIKGQSCVIDLSLITKENMEDAFIAATQNENVCDDIHLLAAQTFHNLKVGDEPVGMGKSGGGPQLIDRRAPFSDSSYVVPQASLGGGQLAKGQSEEPIMNISLSPSVSPRYGVVGLPALAKIARQAQSFRLGESPENTVANTDEASNALADATIVDPEPPVMPRSPAFRDQTPLAPVQPAQILVRKPLMRAAHPDSNARLVHTAEPALVPTAHITFDMGPLGAMEATYHEIIKNDGLLVLVWDNRCRNGKYSPPITDNIITVTIAGTDRPYFVNSYGTRFQHGDYEYCLLVIQPDAEVQQLC